MKYVSVTVLHYGREWLHWALRPMKDLVDESIVVYSPHPSHGHGTSVPCPETREELRDISIYSGAVWYEVPSNIRQEHQHRKYANNLARERHGADVVLVLDADEVWEPLMAEEALAQAATGDVGRWRVPMQHYWRSVGYVCHDPAMPERIINFRGNSKVGYISPKLGKVHHFGYAQSPAIVHYKWLIHGHKMEVRKNWFDVKFLGWRPGMGDVHPTNENFWDPVKFDRGEIAHLIGDHLYYEEEIIT